MKVIIAGGRDYIQTEEDYKAIEELLIKNKVTEVVSGGAKGADEFGEMLANRLEIPITQFLPDWDKFGKRAGPFRNHVMAKYADAVILLPGGRGTDSMRNEAKKANLVFLYERK